MKRHLLTAFALAALVATSLAPPPAQASSQIMCSPFAAGSTPGPQRVTNPNTTTAYNLDNHGCGLIALADVAYFQSQGFVQGANHRTLIASTGVMSGTTSVQLFTLPPGTYIREFIVDNTTSSAVTGGLDIGKTTGAADIVSALTCGANCLTFAGDSALLLRVFSKTAGQAIWMTQHTSGSSNLTITLVYGYF